MGEITAQLYFDLRVSISNTGAHRPREKVRPKTQANDVY